MRLVALASIAVLVTPADAAPKKRKGKVVRVERNRLGGDKIPHLCANIAPDGTAYCYGRRPTSGESLTVFDGTGRRATLAVRVVTPMMDGCGNESSWTVQTTVTSGDISVADWTMIAIGDWPGTAKTHVVQNANTQPVPGGHPGETVWTALDDDGNNVPELMVTYFSCDPSGNPSQIYPSGAQCFSYLEGDGSEFRRIRTDIVKTC